MRPLILALALLSAQPLAAQSLTIAPVADTAYRLRATYHTSSGRAGYYDAPVVWQTSSWQVAHVTPVPGVTDARDAYVTPVDTGGVWIFATLVRKTAPTTLTDSVWVHVRRVLAVAIGAPPAPHIVGPDTIPRDSVVAYELLAPAGFGGVRAIRWYVEPGGGSVFATPTRLEAGELGRHGLLAAWLASGDSLTLTLAPRGTAGDWPRLTKVVHVR